MPQFLHLYNGDYYNPYTQGVIVKIKIIHKDDWYGAWNKISPQDMCVVSFKMIYAQR